MTTDERRKQGCEVRGLGSRILKELRESGVGQLFKGREGSGGAVPTSIREPWTACRVGSACECVALGQGSEPPGG